MAIDADITSRSNALYSAIVATVAASPQRRLTVAEIALRVAADVEVTANCIALHRFLRQAQGGECFDAIFSVPPPPGFRVPAGDETIDEHGLGLIVLRAEPR